MPILAVRNRRTTNNYGQYISPSQNVNQYNHDVSQAVTKQNVNQYNHEVSQAVTKHRFPQCPIKVLNSGKGETKLHKHDTFCIVSKCEVFKYY